MQDRPRFLEDVDPEFSATGRKEPAYKAALAFLALELPVCAAVGYFIARSEQAKNIFHNLAYAIIQVLSNK